MKTAAIKVKQVSYYVFVEYAFVCLTKFNNKLLFLFIQIKKYYMLV